jgi:hypothetical protein
MTCLLLFSKGNPHGEGIRRGRKGIYAFSGLKENAGKKPRPFRGLN